MAFFLLAAFIIVPVIEIGLFIQVGGWLGLWPTLAIVVLTALLGTALLRHQGLGALGRLQQSLERGEMPLAPVFDGFCLLAAGLLLLTPGFFTDAVGLLLFVPPVRRALGALLFKHIHVQTVSRGHHPHGPDAPYGNGDIIDGEWRDVSDNGAETGAGAGPRLPSRPGDE